MEFKKNTLLTVILLVSCIPLSIAQLAWQAKANMPTARKEIADAATVLDGKIYVLGGTNSDGIITNVFESYDPTTDSWTTLAPYPLAVWRTSMEALDGKIYVMGGYQSLSPFPFNPTNQGYSYDPTTDIWTPIQNMLITRGSAASVVLDGEIHLIGGANSGALDEHHSYDPSTDTWNAISTMTETRSGLTASLIDGKIYAAGGYFLNGGVVSKNTAEVYDPGTGLWTSVASMPITKLGITSAVLNGKMYVFGNENNTNVLEYDPINDSWSQLISMPENVNFAGAVATNNRIYVMGGGPVNLSTDGINAMYCFDPTVLGTSDIEQPYNFSLFPNPSSGSFSIEIATPAKELHIINSLGTKMKSILLKDHDRTIALSLSYPSGIYILEILYDDGVRVAKKVLIQ